MQITDKLHNTHIYKKKITPKYPNNHINRKINPTLADYTNIILVRTMFCFWYALFKIIWEVAHAAST